MRTLIISLLLIIMTMPSIAQDKSAVEPTYNMTKHLSRHEDFLKQNTPSHVNNATDNVTKYLETLFSEEDPQDLECNNNYITKLNPADKSIPERVRFTNGGKNLTAGYFNIFHDFKGKISLSSLSNGEPCDIDKFIHLIDNDVTEFYGLNERYNTPLRLKRLKESKEYTDSLVPAFSSLRKSIMSGYYFCLFRIYRPVYNLKTHSFKFKAERYDNMRLNGYFNAFDCIALSCPSLTYKKNDYGRIDSCHLISPKISEDLAADVEDGKCLLMFIFKIDKVYSANEKPARPTKYILCSTKKILLIDAETYETVADWSSLLYPAQRKNTTNATRK